MSRRKGRRSNQIHGVFEDDDPLSGMVNMFDLAIVFAVGLIVALVVATRGGKVTFGPNAKPSELEVPEGEKLRKYKVSNDKGKGPGSRIGAAYRLPNGEIIYVPENGVVPPGAGGPPAGGAPEAPAEAPKPSPDAPHP